MTGLVGLGAGGRMACLCWRLAFVAMLALPAAAGCSVYDPDLLQPQAQTAVADAGPRRSLSPARRLDAGGWQEDAGPPDSGPATGDAGMCGGGCALDHATAGCVDGACQVTACLEAYLDCDGLPQTGCEVDGTSDPGHCGDCDTSCSTLSNTSDVRCDATDGCQVVACQPGFASCDGEHASGCETSLRTLDNCGGCASRGDSQPCVGLPNVTASSCGTASCEIDVCNSGWANCDGNVANGCEHDVSALGPCTPSLKRLVIDPSFVDAPLSDFPVLVRLTGDADLMRARADAGDIFFSVDGGPADGESALSYQIEAWSRAEGELVAWVRLPSVSDSQPTAFFVRYGDGIDYSANNSETDVWGARFESVHHFDGGLGEATSHPISATNVNSTADLEGQIGGARVFSSGAFVSMSGGVLPDSDDYTISAWVKVSLAGGSSVKYVMDTSAVALPYTGMALGVRQVDGALAAYIDGMFRASTRDFAAEGTWHLVAARYHIAGTDGRFETSLDGRPFEVTFVGNTEDARTLSTSPFEVGRWAGGQFFFDGSIDELRVSSAPRSDAWIRAVYENQRAGSTFVRVDE